MDKIAVLGGGHGGHACSADFALAGFKVNLFEMPQYGQTIAPAMKIGGIELVGASREGFAKLNKVTTDIKEAVEGVDTIFVIVPAFGHEIFGEILAPNLKDGQIVIFFGKGGGSLTLAKILRNSGVKKDVILGETNSLPYVAARLTGPAQVRIFAVAGEIFASGLPSKNTQKVVDLLKAIYKSVSPADTVLETILTDHNAILHPPPTILNAGRIEFSKGEFYVYREGLTPAVEKVMMAIDSERLNIMKALGLRQIAFPEIYSRYVGVPKGTIAEMIATKEFARNIKEPSNFQSRFITEDVPYGLVTWSSIADLVDVSTPVIRSLVDLSSAINMVDYWKNGRTIEKLGLSGLNLVQLKTLIAEGAIF